MAPPLAVSTTEPPWQKVVGPPAARAAVGWRLMVAVTAARGPSQPPALTALTKYVVVAVREGVVKVLPVPEFRGAPPVAAA